MSKRDIWLGTKRKKKNDHTLSHIISMTWRDEAACKNKGVSNFFARRDYPQNAEALKFCKECKVKKECLAFALEFEGEGLRYGVWGGVQAMDRMPRKRD